MYGIYIIAIALAGIGVFFGTIALTWWALAKRSETITDDGAKAVLSLCGIFILFAITFGAGGFAVVKDAEKDYEQFLATQDVFEQVYVAENELENIKLTETILEMNGWLVNAKANKKTYGWFSRYYYLNVEDLEPIGKR